MNKKIFVIGSGLSGLVASTELLKKGYHVTMLGSRTSSSDWWSSLLVIRRAISS